MTTKVSIEPSSHAVQVTHTDRWQSDDATRTTTTTTITTLKPGAPPYQVWLSGDGTMAVRELPDGAAGLAAAGLTPANFGSSPEAP